MAIKKYTNGSWVTARYRKYGTETDTITTLPATVIGDGTPISSYTIKGNMEQSGTPTPSNPIYPSECGEKTEQIFDISSISLGKWYTDNGLLQDYTYGAISEIKKVNGNRITIKWHGLVPFSFSIVWFDINKNFILRNHYIKIDDLDTFAFNAPSGAVYFIFQMANGIDESNPITIEQIASYRAMLNFGSTALPYEPYGHKLPLTLGNTTTNIYLGEVQSTRRIKKLVLTGEENWRSNYDEFFFTNVNSSDFRDTTFGLLCSHLPVILRDDFNRQPSAFWGRAQIGDVCLCTSSTIMSLSNFKSYLAAQYAAGTPVTIWYVLAEPTTGIVNEPIRKIGDYVDSVSGTNLATSGTAQQFDVGTTLKPSEVDLAYHGWHEHEDTKYSA